MIKRILAATAAAMLIMAACAGRQVARVDETSKVDLSGRWNDTDSRLVAEEMMKDGLSRAWITDFSAARNRKPAVIVGQVKNKSHELIATDIFVKDIEREFINSGRVKVVQAGEARQELRQERKDQATNVDAAYSKQWGRELGADFVMQGTLNSIVDSYENKKVVLYQVDLELSDVESGEKVWIGTKKIKKFIKN